jgi:hypothetical protein
MKRSASTNCWWNQPCGWQGRFACSTLQCGQQSLIFLKSFFKQSVQFIFNSLFFGSFIVCLPEAEKITKIGAGFIQHPFRLQLPAIIVDTALIKSAIPAIDITKNNQHKRQRSVIT